MPKNWSRDYYSHKFNSAAVRYELALCIQTGEIVWFSGPYAAGKWVDIEIFRHGLMYQLDYDEKVEADDGYRGEPDFVKCPALFINGFENIALQQRVRSRHETVNRRFKHWQILYQRYRHEEVDHGAVVGSIMVVSQLAIFGG